MNEKLEQTKAEYIDKLKRLKLAQAGFDYSNIDNYVKYLKTDDEKELEKEAEALLADVRQHNTATDVYIDATAWKPF